MRLSLARPSAFAPLLAASLAFLHCGGSTNGTTPNGGNDPPPTVDGGGTDGGDLPNPDAVGATTSSKVDLLLVVDNSASMGEKAKALVASLDPLLEALAAKSSDVHIGVIDSSLGAMGGDVCPEGRPGANGFAHLRTTGPSAAPVPSAQATGFLAYTGGASLASVIADTKSLVAGVGESGCGLEAQLESAYRFLVQPDPWNAVTVDNGLAQLTGVDGVLLAQRKAFLRPDSLVAVVMLTDEDDAAMDPLSLGGQGYAFASTKFPGSTTVRADGVTSTAPRATSACATAPGSADCTSCGFALSCDPSTPECQKLRNDPECRKNDGFYGADEDAINTRAFAMKRRFGVDPQFPLWRYVNGFTKTRAPDRAGEHPIRSTPPAIGAYEGTARCTNPLFAASLPGSASEELCNLPPGTRGKELVVFAVIGGVPESLATATPDWTKILGQDPDAYDATGQDVHMIPSITPRPGLPGPSATPGDNGTDPVSGREYDTRNQDLQYACTFALPAPRSCTSADVGCDCAADSGMNPPLCSAPGIQTRGKAYPSLRELRVVKALGDRGIAGSICPTDASLGYVSTMQTLASRLAPRIQ